MLRQMAPLKSCFQSHCCIKIRFYQLWQLWIHVVQCTQFMNWQIDEIGLCCCRIRAWLLLRFSFLVLLSRLVLSLEVGVLSTALFLVGAKASRFDSNDSPLLFDNVGKMPFASSLEGMNWWLPSYFLGVQMIVVSSNTYSGLVAKSAYFLYDWIFCRWFTLLAVLTCVP